MSGNFSDIIGRLHKWLILIGLAKNFVPSLRKRSYRLSTSVAFKIELTFFWEQLILIIIVLLYYHCSTCRCPWVRIRTTIVTWCRSNFFVSVNFHKKRSTLLCSLVKDENSSLLSCNISFKNLENCLFFQSQQQQRFSRTLNS